MPSLEHGLSVYFKYFTKEDETNMVYNSLSKQLFFN